MKEFQQALENPEVAYATTISAVQECFPHLSWGQIMTPPHNMFDAALARQFALYLMVERFGVPKRRVCEIAGIGREVFWRFLPKFEDRIKTNNFANYVDKVEQLSREKIQDWHSNNGDGS